MSIITSQQITRYFEQYRETEVTFNKQVITATGLIPRNVYMKIHDGQWPCVIFSTSMIGAKVIADVKTLFFGSLRRANNHLQLRFCFKQMDKPEPMSFYVPCLAVSFTPYNPKNPDVQVIALEYSQRPPDDLIYLLGSLLEANSNAQRRKEERIILTAENMKKLNLDTRDALFIMDNTSRKCIFRDLSFSGASVLTSGPVESFTNKQIVIRMAKSDSAEEMLLKGTVKRADGIEGRKDIVALGIQFDAEIPMSYKLLINSFISTMRKVPKAAQPAAAKAAAEKPEPGAEQEKLASDAGSAGAPAEAAEPIAGSAEPAIDSAEPAANQQSTEPDFPDMEDPVDATDAQAAPPKKPEAKAQAAPGKQPVAPQKKQGKTIDG